MRSASPTEVPPNFWTTTGIATTLMARAGPLGPKERRCLIQHHPAGQIGSRAVPSDKRARQRAARDQRLAHEAQAKKRRKQIRNVIVIAVIAGLVILIVFLTSSNSPKSPSKSSTTTSTTVAVLANAKLQAAANNVAVAAGCPASTSTRVNTQSYSSAPATTIDTSTTYTATVVTTAGTYYL